MLEDHLESPVTRNRLRSGPLFQHIDGFADWLASRGYKSVSMDGRLRNLAPWSDWMRQAGFGQEELVAGFLAYKQALAEEGRLRYGNGKYHGTIPAGALFIRFLQESGQVPTPASPVPPCAKWPLLGEYRAWIVQQRGLKETSVDMYQRVLVDFVSGLGDDPSTYTVQAIRQFVLGRAAGHGVARAQSIVVAIRGFLRFLGATGRCRAGMEYGVPGFASWHLSSIPRFLCPQDMERVINACVPNGVQGRRDRAVVLLLARLGLRASDVAALSLADLDWGQGRLAVCGKGRRQEWLPLPQEVGYSLLDYLQHARPKIETQRVFITVDAPLRPMSRACVTHVVRSALRRAGVKAPINGAHVLRHSAATAMLRQGASLAGVGAVLRHRSPSTTAHYAKVDFQLLREIAQPWPEVHKC